MNPAPNIPAARSAAPAVGKPAIAELKSEIADLGRVPPGPKAEDRDSKPEIPISMLAPRRTWLSPAWLIPILALVFVGVLLYQVQMQRGPRIVITFENGSGIEPNDPVSYRGVRVGTVRTVTLAGDLSNVRVEADLRPDAAGLARIGTSFWVVRPEVSLTRVSGLETLVGPRYIAAEPSLPSAPIGGGGIPAAKLEFVGLNHSPRDGTTYAPGDPLDIVLRAQRLGSITESSAVTYRDMKVGSVTRISFTDDARRVELGIRIEPQFARLVRSNTKFWNVSGLGLDMGLFRGLKLKAESLETVLAGGIALATPSPAAAEVSDGHVFEMEPGPVEEAAKWSPDLSAR